MSSARLLDNTGETNVSLAEASAGAASTAAATTTPRSPLTPADSFYRNKNRRSVASIDGAAAAGDDKKDVEAQNDSNGNTKGNADAASEGGSSDSEKDSKKEKKPLVPMHRLWRFASPFDLVLLFVGAIGAMVQGVTQPLMTIVFGNLIDAFGPGADIVSSVNQACIYFVIIGCVAFGSGFIYMAAFGFTATQQAKRIRHNYLRAIIRQEMGWFDKIQSGELTTRIAGDVLVVQEGIGEKIGQSVQYTTMFVAGFVIGFIRNWKMALVILSVVPLLGISGAIIGKFLASFTTRGQKAYARAGAVAEEVLASMRTVTAFNGQDKEDRRYGEELTTALNIATKGGHLRGISFGVIMFIMFCSYALAFWYGGELISQGQITAGEIVNVFFAVVMGAMGLGQAAPGFTALAAARGAAYTIFETIDRHPEIDTLSEEGEKPSTVRGDISFENIHFSYPKRPDVPIVNGLTVSIKAGQTLALVGPSGCGKSTTVALLQRFYDPASGLVTLDGTDIRKLNIRWLRSQIGVVSQEPILFGRSISENILLGKPGAKQGEIEDAARMANAHDFISKLPKGYDTLVGERGASLSGGQKQRIAIARALLSNPKILLLDEATSALDTKSERVVQDALDRASRGRTTIVIAHRLSTIQHADKIVVIEKGNVIEQGMHNELMAKDGLYASLVRTQQLRGAIKGADGNKDEKSELITSTTTELLAEDDVILPQDPPPERPKTARTATNQSKSGQDNKKPGEQDEVDPEDAKVPTKGAVWRAYKYNAPEWFYVALGVFASLINGSVFPIYAILFSHVLQDFLLDEGEQLKQAASFWSLMFLCVAVAVGLANYFQNAMLAIAGERLTARLRAMLFRTILRQSIGWFDEERHSTGALATRLANDSARVQGAVGGNLGIMAQSFSTIVVGLIIAFTACWQLALVVLGAVPLAALGGAVQFKMMLGFNAQARLAYEESGKIAAETVENIRTVISLGREQTFQDAYSKSLEVPNRSSRRQALLNGLAFGFSQMMTFFIWAMSFAYGAHLVAWGVINFGNMMQAITAIIFGGMMIGQATQLAPDFNKAVIAAANIFFLYDQVPTIDSASKEGHMLASVVGKVKFENVTFRYPTRPEAQILRGLSFELEPGKTMALVGSSGCGKSTVIGLLERFYDPESGTIYIDDIPTRDVNVASLRDAMGLVGQEPILFATSIYENIRYGKSDATREEIEQAAKNANIHSFIMTLPDKYETYVGEKGTQLSGGQKQRIAIARALVRNPKILLLDEATSALDSESEKIVQEALDLARRGRTTIVIAHRLSTIQDADVICVVDAGVIVERGTHQQLLDLEGQYYQLVTRQAVPL